MYGRALSCVLVASGLLACSGGEESHMFAPPIPSGYGGHGGGLGSGAGGAFGFDAGGPKGPPSLDAGGLCGNQIHEITTEPPIVYFIFDISGSMATAVNGGTRYSVVQSAAAKMVETLKYVIKPGAAAFPLNTNGGTNACHPGGEIFPPTFLNPYAFDVATGSLTPFGGTPTAATLLALKPRLTSLKGKVIAVLATDGGPNCNAQASCTASQCSENIEGCPPQDTCCAAGTNCCAPGGPAGPLNCVDSTASVSAVASLHAAGIQVSIVGIPGSQVYANVLTQMAFAGGAPQPAAPFYYDVQDLSTLGAVLSSIATGGISCDITIADPPSTPDETNVYLDQQILPSDPVNGWTWTAANVVTLHGTACAQLKSGSVADVQVVSGCPTQATK